MASRLEERYKSEIQPALAQKFGRDNKLSLPKLEKIVLSTGFGRAATRGEKGVLEEAVGNLTQIAGQRAVGTVATKSVAGFRVREGMKVGAKVTLRGARMYEFLDRLISIALPRVRDFRGVSNKAFDGNGNYNLGLNEQGVFPEVDLDKAKFSMGMNITVVVRNATDAESLELLTQFGMPFRKPEARR